MSQPILSQAEIDALLKETQTSHPSVDEELLGVFQGISQPLAASLTKVLQLHPVIEGPYVETVTPGTRIFHDQTYVIPIELYGGDLLALIPDSDGTLLASQIGTEVRRAISLVVDEFTNTLGKQLAREKRQWLTYKRHNPVLITVQQLSTLPIQTNSFLVRFGVSWHKQGIELGLLLSPKLTSSLTNAQVQGASDFIKVKPATQGERLSTIPKFSSVNKRDVPVSSMQFADLTKATQEGTAQKLQLLTDIQINIYAELGRTQMLLGEIMDLQVNSVIPLNKMAGEPCDLFLNGHPIAKAEVLVLEENFGARILEIVPANQRLQTK